jgi:hypothetical protein
MVRISSAIRTFISHFSWHAQSWNSLSKTTVKWYSRIWLPSLACLSLSLSLSLSWHTNSLAKTTLERVFVGWCNRGSKGGQAGTWVYVLQRVKKESLELK